MAATLSDVARRNVASNTTSQLETTPTAAATARPPFRVRVEQAQTLLRERYPDLFGDHPKPLKIGIHRDLLERHPDLDLSGLKRALTLYTGRFSYQKLLKAGAVRFDLDGQPAGEVTAEQAEIAKGKMAAIKAKDRAKSPAPTPASTPPAISSRPILKLKKPGTVVAAVVVTRRAKP